MSIGKGVPLVQKQLARELLRLRNLSGLTQGALGKRIDLSQSMVSRVERGEKLISLPKILAWAEACGGAQEVTDRLTTLTQATFTQAEALRELMPQASQLQDAVGANETTTRTLLNYSPTVIPGLLQIPGYAEYVLRLTNYRGDMDEAASLAGRWRRQQGLNDRSRHFGFLLREAVLRWSPNGPDLLASQLDRVAMVAAQDNVSLSIIRTGTETILPLHGFVIYADRDDDDPRVIVELVHTYVTERDPAEVALYQELYERMASVATSGPDAVAMIQRIAAELRHT